MDMIPILLAELEQEAQTTRKMLTLVPDDKFDWQPHPKSMTMLNLATHIAEIAAWPGLMLNTDGLDFGTMDYTPTPVHNNADLLTLFEKSLADAKAALEAANEAQLTDTWTMRNGDVIFRTYRKHEALRVAYCQTVHHRAQLGVYLRLLAIPIPGSYGPSADDNSF